MSKVRVNVKSAAVNSKSIRREKRGGRDVIIVPSATLPDNVVMNRILYPADEIAKSFESLNRTFAPLSHPRVDNVYVSAREPEAIIGYWAGAWNENVRRENGRVYLDKVIDVAEAEKSERGKALLKAVNDGDPIHTSTGIFMETEDAEHNDYDKIARNMVFDHDAILLNEEGAATPEQGVGIFVNSDGSHDEVKVLESQLSANDALPDSVEQVRDKLSTVVSERFGPSWVTDFNDTHVVFYSENDTGPRRVSYTVEGDRVTVGDDVQAVEMSRTWQVVNRLLDVVKRALTGTSNEPNSALLTNQTDEVSEMTPEELKAALAEQAQTIQTNTHTAIGEAVKAAIEPIQAELDQLKANREAGEKAAKDEAILAVVNAGLLDQAEAEQAPLAVLQKLAANAKPASKAAGLNGAPPNSGNEGDDAWKDYNLNAALDEGDK